MYVYEIVAIQLRACVCIYIYRFSMLLVPKLDANYSMIIHIDCKTVPSFDDAAQSLINQMRFWLPILAPPWRKARCSANFDLDLPKMVAWKQDCQRKPLAAFGRKVLWWLCNMPCLFAFWMTLIQRCLATESRKLHRCVYIVNFMFCSFVWCSFDVVCVHRARVLAFLLCVCVRLLKCLNWFLFLFFRVLTVFMLGRPNTKQHNYLLLVLAWTLLPISICNVAPVVFRVPNGTLTFWFCSVAVFFRFPTGDLVVAVGVSGHFCDTKETKVIGLGHGNPTLVSHSSARFSATSEQGDHAAEDATRNAMRSSAIQMACQGGWGLQYLYIYICLHIWGLVYVVSYYML